MEEQRLISLENISKEFDGTTVLDNINLYIRKNEFLTLLGPSGCGKTTTLRIIGGFETPDSGRVVFDGQEINDVPPYKRRVNTVFQKYALFPHLNGAENVLANLLSQYVFSFGHSLHLVCYTFPTSITCRRKNVKKRLTLFSKKIHKNSVDNWQTVENGAGWHFLLLGLPQKRSFCGKRRSSGVSDLFTE